MDRQNKTIASGVVNEQQTIWTVFQKFRVREKSVGCIGISENVSTMIFNPSLIRLSHNICPESKNNISSHFKTSPLNQSIPLHRGRGNQLFQFFFLVSIQTRNVHFLCKTNETEADPSPRFRHVFRQSPTVAFRRNQHTKDLLTYFLDSKENKFGICARYTFKNSRMRVKFY